MVGADLRDLLAAHVPVSQQQVAQVVAAVVLVGNVHVVMAIDGYTGMPAYILVPFQGLEHPRRPVVPGVLQVPVRSVVVCYVGPVVAV